MIVGFSYWVGSDSRFVRRAHEPRKKPYARQHDKIAQHVTLQRPAAPSCFQDTRQTAAPTSPMPAILSPLLFCKIQGQEKSSQLHGCPFINPSPSRSALPLCQSQRRLGCLVRATSGEPTDHIDEHSEDSGLILLRRGSSSVRCRSSSVRKELHDALQPRLSFRQM